MKLCKGMKIVKGVEAALSVREAMVCWVDHTAQAVRVNNLLADYTVDKQRRRLKGMLRFLNAYTQDKKYRRNRSDRILT